MIKLYSLVAEITQSKTHHARFLNTLASMELTGAQKLSRLLPSMHLSTFFLEHIAEEYRHAYFLRTLAEKVAFPQSLKPHTIFCPHLSRGYISTLERSLSCLLREKNLADKNHIKNRVYLLSTFAIESRALIFYEIYQQVLDNNPLNISVRSILSEEKKHLSTIKSYISQDSALNNLCELSLALEKRLFERWMSEIYAIIKKEETTECMNKTLCLS
jgi:rubrerythrin